MKRLLRKIKQFFCKHDYTRERIPYGFFSEGGWLFSSFRYTCKKCGRSFTSFEKDVHMNCRHEVKVDERMMEKVIDIEKSAELTAKNEKKNRWIEVADEDFDWVTFYICSKCQKEAERDGKEDFILSKYCPNCGAEMENGT